MSQGIEILIRGESLGVLRMLEALDTALNPAAIATFLGAQVVPYLQARATARFASEGDDVVGGWAPLKQATQDIRSQQGYGSAHPINRRTGELERFITEGSGDLQVHPWGASVSLPGRLPDSEMAAKVTRAQVGDDRTVARPVLGMNERDLAFVLLSLTRTIETVGNSFI